MSVHPLDDHQLDAQVDAILDDPEAALDTGLFEVNNKERANRAVWKIGRIEAELEEDEALHKAERARLDAWITDRRLRAEKAIEFLTTLTAGFHAIVLAEDPQRKTIKLPAGDLVARKQPDVWEIDTPTVLAWAVENGREDLIRRRDPEVDRPAVKKALRPADGSSRALDPASGELVPGVKVTQGEVRYTAKPRVVEQ